MFQKRKSYTPEKTNMTMKNPPCEKEIFQCHISFQGSTVKLEP